MDDGPIPQPSGMYGGVLVHSSPKPFPKKSPYSKSELNQLRKALQEEHNRLRRELASMESLSEGSNENPGHSLHIAEFASDMQATETMLGLRRVNEERLQLVEEALDIIAKAVAYYGLCRACGAKIGIQRLIAKPHAHLCMDCRQRYERNRRY